jgi:ribosome-binding protein aMBF1 (putative translation factor)
VRDVIEPRYKPSHERADTGKTYRLAEDFTSRIAEHRSPTSVLEASLAAAIRLEQIVGRTRKIAALLLVPQGVPLRPCSR